eukprot:scaffold101093_cov27-Attheya_sp.AAC.5
MVPVAATLISVMDMVVCIAIKDNEQPVFGARLSHKVDYGGKRIWFRAWQFVEKRKVSLASPFWVLKR